MFDLDIERALQRHCDAAPQYQTLFAQWTFDKQLVGGALRSVALTFPHYSLHDASHADTILRQIARVLGPKRLERLSPTDLWLLLEAAYQHDIGMVVPERTMRAWWNEPSFDAFIDRLKTHADEDIRHAAAMLDKKTGKPPQTSDWPFEVRRALALLMADFARTRHAEQSRRIVDGPGQIGLDTPRNALVPRRFWGLLGRICESHGKSFKALWDLPQVESGFGVDDAHPRFVAAMLRLGDLLDLDDGRFCPVLSKTFGGLPPSSKAHEEKHHSIEEFYVGPTEIRVVAKCKNAAAFDATEQWLTWLREELRDLNTSWSRISPDADFGVIASAGKIEPQLVNYLPLPDGRRPRFEVDKLAMLDFVKGAGLYTDPMDCIAELLQNAVDATLLRVWAEDQNRWREAAQSGRNDVLDKLRKELEKYPIDVKVEKSKRDGDQNHWHVVIEDRGAGIRREDISFLQCIGSSKKNPRRMERLRDMPEWMKPAGYFGIGLQSAFLFTDKLVIRSRADDALETLEIEYIQPKGEPAPEPELLVKALSSQEGMSKPGTRIELVLREKLVRESVSLRGDYQETTQTFRDYDPLVDDELPLLPCQIRDKTRTFAQEALVPVRLDGKKVEVERQQTKYFDPETGIALSLRASRKGSLDFFFRGRAAHLDGDFGHLALSLIWHKGNAAELLTFNREKVRDSAGRKVGNEIAKALHNVLPRYYEAIKDDPDRIEELRWLALIAKTEDSGTALHTTSKLPKLEQWKDIPYFDGGAETYGQLFNADEVTIIEDQSFALVGDTRPTIKCKGTSQLTLNTGTVEPDLWRILMGRHVSLVNISPIPEPRWSHLNLFEWRVQKNHDGNQDVIASDDAFRWILRTAAVGRFGPARRTIPCRNRFRAMALCDGAEKKLGYGKATLSRLKPRAIFPFRVGADNKLSLDGLDRLIEFTYTHRAQQETTKVDIARAVLDLIQYTDELLREDWAKDNRIDYSVDDWRRKLMKTYGNEVIPKAE